MRFILNMECVRVACAFSADRFFVKDRDSAYVESIALVLLRHERACDHVECQSTRVRDYATPGKREA